MKQLILHPTELSQWYAIVNEAEASTHLLLNENTESYLVFLLMRFSHSSKLMESVIALDFLNCFNNIRHRQIQLLRDVGDKSLLFCGLFPGIARKRRVSLNYFAELGQAAYLTIGELEEHRETNLYCQLSAQFPSLRQILQTIREGSLIY